MLLHLQFLQWLHLLMQKLLLLRLLLLHLLLLHLLLLFLPLSMVADAALVAVTAALHPVSAHVSFVHEREK